MANVEHILVLVRFFLEAFTPTELRRFLFDLPGGSRVAEEIPWDGAPHAFIAEIVAMALARRGMIDHTLMRALAQARPARIGELRHVWPELGAQPLAIDFSAEDSKPPVLPPAKLRGASLSALLSSLMGSLATVAAAAISSSAILFQSSWPSGEVLWNVAGGSAAIALVLTAFIGMVVAFRRLRRPHDRALQTLKAAYGQALDESLLNPRKAGVSQ